MLLNKPIKINKEILLKLSNHRNAFLLYKSHIYFITSFKVKKKEVNYFIFKRTFIYLINIELKTYNNKTDKFIIIENKKIICDFIKHIQKHRTDFILNIKEPLLKLGITFKIH